MKKGTNEFKCVKFKQNCKMNPCLVYVYWIHNKTHWGPPSSSGIDRILLDSQTSVKRMWKSPNLLWRRVHLPPATEQSEVPRSVVGLPLWSSPMKFEVLVQGESEAISGTLVRYHQSPRHQQSEIWPHGVLSHSCCQSKAYCAADLSRMQTSPYQHLILGVRSQGPPQEHQWSQWSQPCSLAPDPERRFPVSPTALTNQSVLNAVSWLAKYQSRIAVALKCQRMSLHWSSFNLQKYHAVRLLLNDSLYIVLNRLVSSLTYAMSWFMYRVCLVISHLTWISTQMLK